jgi:uncharacterized protein (TIGR02145 family)
MDKVEVFGFSINKNINFYRKKMNRNLKNIKNKISELVFCLSLFILSACQTIDLESDGINSTQEVKGKIILPQGSKLDVNSFTVFSNIDNSPVQGEEYGLSKGGKFTGLYVSNANDEVVMMGFQYPGNPTNEINSTTTALGLILMAPIFFDLTEEGMLKLIDSILKDSSFPSLKAEIEKNIVQGRSLFDIENAPLIATLNSILKSAGLRVAQNEKELPVNLFKAGKNFTFNNSGNSFSTVIGIYKGNDRVKKITVDGVQIFAGSITELLTATGGTFETPVDHPYSIPGDGEYTFKFRTGKPGAGDGSIEHDEAFYENLKQYSINLLSGLLPQLDREGTAACLISVSSNVYGTISTLTSLKTNPSLTEVLLTVSEITLNNIGGLLEDCVTKPNKNFFESFLKQLKLFSFASGAMNTGAFGYHWLSSEAVVDICYTSKGNDVTENENCGNSIVDSRDGNVYKTVKIGNQVWFAENLRYAGNIPEAADYGVWMDRVRNGQAAWVYNNNDPNNNSLYGKLYNWIAVNTGNLCPPGWHIPSDEEWTVLTNFLGGEEVAGGKMKSVTGWPAPNVAASNESGFSGLPGGSPNMYVYFTPITRIGGWWTSSFADSYGNWYRSILNSESQIKRSSSTDYYFAPVTNVGFSCRCLKDGS